MTSLDQLLDKATRPTVECTIYLNCDLAKFDRMQDIIIALDDPDIDKGERRASERNPSTVLRAELAKLRKDLNPLKIVLRSITPLELSEILEPLKERGQDQDLEVVGKHLLAALALDPPMTLEQAEKIQALGPVATAPIDAALTRIITEVQRHPLLQRPQQTGPE
ncbi:hypothetical protein JT358_11565 [Micrococcales bacterium 31B]|nr:hypothetical protein [Micrococcales bacterium 31B]